MLGRSLKVLGILLILAGVGGIVLIIIFAARGPQSFTCSGVDCADEILGWKFPLSFTQTATLSTIAIVVGSILASIGGVINRLGQAKRAFAMGTGPSPYMSTGVNPYAGTTPAAPGTSLSQIPGLAAMTMGLGGLAMSGAQTTSTFGTFDGAGGVPARGTITAAQDTGVNIGDTRLIVLDLQIDKGAGDTYTTKSAALVPSDSTAKAIPGVAVAVKVHPNSPGQVFVDWANS